MSKYEQTMRTKMVRTVKYAGSSLVVGAALTQILVHFAPSMQPIAPSIQALITFLLNLVLVRSGILSEE